MGDEIGDQAFAEWLARQPQAKNPPADKNAEQIAAAVWDLVQNKRLKLPRGGYLVRRGRGRVIVEPAKSE